MTKGIWRSTDGINWANLTPPGWPAFYRRIAIGISPSNQNAVYFLADTSGAQDGHALWKYTYLSGNGSGSGGAWVNRSANMPAGFVSYASYCLVVKVKPDNENTVFIGGLSLYRSTDGFATNTNTTALTSGDMHVDNHAIVFSPTSATTTFVGNDGGVYRTTNNLATPVTWTALNAGYLTSQFYTVAVDHAAGGNSVVIGGTQDNGTWFTNTTNAATPWTSIFGGAGAYCAIADNRASYYISYQNGVAYRLLLNDNGALSGLTRVDPTRASNAVPYLFINPFALDPNDTRIMYLAGGDRLWRNSDLTAIPLSSSNTTSFNWTELTNTAAIGGAVTTIGVSRAPANRLYYGSAIGRVYRLEGANSGNPFPVDVWTGRGFPVGAYANCIAVDPTNADRALMVFSNYSVISLFYTTNAGANWTAVAGNLEQSPNGAGAGPSTRWAAILPTSGATTYFVGTSTGVYSTASLNGGSTVWALEGAGIIGNVVVDMLDVRPADGLVVAATHGRGIFSANIGAGITAPTVTTMAATNVLPTAALLHGSVNPNGAGTTAYFEYGTTTNYGSTTGNLDVAREPALCRCPVRSSI